MTTPAQLNLFNSPRNPRFEGSDYKPERDHARLANQYNRIFSLMKDGKWRTLGEIEAITGAPAASISAQLRHARKPRFGQHTLNKRYCGAGLYQYQLIINQNS